MQTGWRQFEAIGPAQGPGIDKKPLKIAFVVQGFQQRPLPRCQVGVNIEHTAPAVGKDQLDSMMAHVAGFQQLHHDRLSLNALQGFKTLGSLPVVQQFPLMGKTPLLDDGGHLAGQFPLGDLAGLDLNQRLEPLILHMDILGNSLFDDMP